MSHDSVITVSADALAPDLDKTLSGTLLTKLCLKVY